MTEVIMPKMGDGMEEGTLIDWAKKDGEAVKSGETIGHIQTDKATLELEAPASGTLTGLLIQAGETVPVGRLIAVILQQGEALPSGYGGGNGSPKQLPAQQNVPSGNGEGEAATAKETPPATPRPAVAQEAMQSLIESVSAQRIKASPLARRIAEQKGINLASIKGTGPGGRIVEKDVLALEAVGSRVGAGMDRTVPLSKLRQIIAQRTQQSKQQAPHFYVTVEVDLEKIVALREMFEQEESGKVSINDFVLKASAEALREMPEANASLTDQGILQHGSVHIGMAVAIADGLVVPVIKNADGLSLRELSAKAKELAGKAREGKLLPDEMQGSTFSISNMGMLDVDNFVAIINQPNAAIVAIGSARRKVVVGEGDAIEIRSRMNITGSFDHRVLDGAMGAKFMNILKSYLENPTRLFD